MTRAVERACRSSQGLTLEDQIEQLSLDLISDSPLTLSTTIPALCESISKTPLRAQSFTVAKPNVSWSAIGGYATIKARLHRILSGCLENRDTFSRLGIKPPSGILLYGPTGCGKTLIAHAMASNCAMNYISAKR